MEFKSAPLSVVVNVIKFLEKHLPKYTVADVVYKSNHPDDDYLFMVSAKKSDGTWACWTCWNESTQSLNYGHYNLLNKESVTKVFIEFYHHCDL